MKEPNRFLWVVRFKDFEADLRTGELRKRGLRVRLPEQPFQVLTVLLEQPGELVTRDELQKKLWPADTFVDLDLSLNAAIKKLRQALRDSAESPQFVETLPKRGYRFIAPVEYIRTSSGGAASLRAVERPPIVEATHEPLPQGVPRQITPIARWSARALAVLGTVGLLFLVSEIGQWRGRLPDRKGPGRIDSLAVLPLENLSGDPAQEYLADGMTEALITNLAKISALRVISCTSSMQYKGTRKSLKQIARELNVDGVVEGSVLRSGSHVRIAAQLIDARTDRHLLAENYEWDLQDIAALQGEVAKAITNTIRMELTSQEQTWLAGARPVNPEAHEAYLRGRYCWNKFTDEGLRKGIEYFHQAIRRQPDFAPAYSGLADSYFRLTYSVNRLSPTEAFPKAKAAAEKALRVDDALAEAHNSLANVRLFYDWDLAGAELEYKRAIELNPGYAEAHYEYSHCLVAEGRIQAAFAEARRALELDPIDLAINNNLAWNYLFARQYEQSAQASRKSLEMDPNFSLGHWFLGLAEELEGDLAGAFAEYQKAASLSQNRPAHFAGLAHLYAVEGKRSEAFKIISDLKEQAKQRYVPALDIAFIYVALGDKDEAFHWLQKAIEERSSNLIYAKVEPRLDDLRFDLRFEGLLRQIGLSSQTTDLSRASSGHHWGPGSKESSEPPRHYRLRSR